MTLDIRHQTELLSYGGDGGGVNGRCTVLAISILCYGLILLIILIHIKII